MKISLEKIDSLNGVITAVVEPEDYAENVKKEIKKDMPSRMHARRQLLKTLYPVVEVPQENKGRKRNTKTIY